jgi:hypothetical protein
MLKMKRLLLLVILVLALVAPVEARKGVGIVWDSQTEMVNEDTTHCLTYGIYNPWDEDVTALLDVSGEIANVLEDRESTPTLIKAHTYHGEAIPVKLCFLVPRVYEHDCLIGGSVCEKECTEESVSYKGEILVKEQKEGAIAAASGSVTALGVATPLTLKVACSPHDRDWTGVYGLGAGLVVILIALLIAARVRFSRKKKAEGLVE